MILDNINSPSDLKKLSISELPVVAQEIREGLFNRLTKIGEIGRASCRERV